MLGRKDRNGGEVGIWNANQTQIKLMITLVITLLACFRSQLYDSGKYYILYTTSQYIIIPKLFSHEIKWHISIKVILWGLDLFKDNVIFCVNSFWLGHELM